MDTPTSPWWSAPLIDAGKVALGAIIGFLATQVKDWRDRKRTETAFLSAVHQELQTIRKQLVKSFAELEGSLQRLKSGSRVVLVFKISTKVFDSQLSTLKDLTNPLILKVADLYSTLDLLDTLSATINTLADEVSTAKDEKQSRTHVASAILVTQEEIQRYQRMIDALLKKFPLKIRNELPQ